MATSTITGTITNPVGTALSGVRVICRLKPGGAHRSADGSEVAGQVETTTNGSGVYSFTLERNSGISPSNTYYELEEQITEANGGPRGWAISVGAANATVFASLVSPSQATGLLPFLTQAQADARYAAIGAIASITGEVNLADLGADMTGATNNAAILQNAINALPAAGGTIRCPEGTIRCDTAPTIGSRRIIFQGSGLATSIISATNFSSSGTFFDATAAGRGSIIFRDIALYGPGIGTTATGVKGGHGTTFDNSMVAFWGYGCDMTAYNDLVVTPTAEFNACGVAIKNAADANIVNISGRFIACTTPLNLRADQLAISHAWFELNTSTEITVNGSAAVVTVEDTWIENAHTDPPIKVISGLSYQDVHLIDIHRNEISVLAAEILEVNQAQLVRVRRNKIYRESSANIKVTQSVESLDVACNLTVGDDGVSDRSYNVAIGITGGGHVVEVIEAPNMRFRAIDKVEPFAGGYAYDDVANLISDSGIESALTADGAGASAPTVTWDTGAYLGAKAIKGVFLAAAVGNAGYIRTNRQFSATSGSYYVLEFSAKASVPMRAIGLRMLDFAGSFDPNALNFFEVNTTYRRYRVLWKCPVTSADWMMTFSKTVASDADVSLWIDDLAAYDGPVAGPYLPGITATIPRGTWAHDQILAGSKLMVGYSAAGATPGTCVKKIEVFSADGVSLGFVPVYDAIT